MRDCVKRIVEASKGTIDQENARQLLSDIDRAAKKRASEGFDYDDAVKQIVRERTELSVENIAKQKENIARNAVIRARTVTRVSEFIDGGMSIKDAIRAEIEGIEGPQAGAKDAAALQQRRTQYAYVNRFVRELEAEGLLGLYNSGTLNDEIGEELFALSIGKTVTQSREAKKIADIVFKTLDGQRLRQNRSGADIQQIDGYVLPQRHDAAAMHKVGEDGVVEFAKPLLNESRSFGGGAEDFDLALRQAYRAMVSGTRLNDPMADNAKLFQFTGPANLAKRLSQSRQLVFKDYQSWKTWNDAFGIKDIREGILDAILYNSDNIALLERYGTNPEAMLAEVTKKTKQKYRDKAASERELGIDSKAQDIIDGLLRKNDIPVNPTLAMWGSNIRGYQNITKLGGVLLSALPDTGFKSLEYKFQGKTWLGATAQSFIDSGYMFKSQAEKFEYASLTGVYAETAIGDIASKFSTHDNPSQRMGKLQRLFFKLNLLTQWNEGHKMAMSKVMSHHLGLKKGVAYDQLDEDTLRLFGNYRITEKDWDIAQEFIVKLDDGRDYLAPELMPDAQREKFIGYFVDRIDSGVITPGARERRVLTFGTRRGTPLGETVRFAMQYKSFPVTVATKVWARALYGKGKADIPSMLYLGLVTSALGYVAMTAKDYMKGRSPKDPNKWETWIAAIAQGGGLSIWGEVLLADATYGRSATSILAGPTFGTFDDLMKIYSAAIRGDGSEAQALRTAIGAVPFNNIFYVRAAADQMLLMQMMEDLSPGYLRRMENNMKRVYGQELLYQ